MTVTYEPRGGARELMMHRGPEVLLSGPAGTGKTLAMLHKLNAACVLVPGCAALLVRQTQVSLVRSTLVTFEKQVVPGLMASGEVSWFGGSGRRPSAYEYSNGSRLFVAGMDRPAAFLSMDLDRIGVDEANQVSRTAVETLLTRLRGHAATYKQLVAACNPDAPSHHLYERAQTGAMRHIHSVHTDNPYLYGPDGSLTEVGRDYMARLDSLTGVRRLRYRDGIWAAAEGLVYDGWSEAVNVVPFGSVPETQRVIWSVDFGYSNAFVWQEWRIDHDGRMYLTREISRKQRLVEDHARDILELTGGYRPEAIICDHDAEDRATLERHLRMPTVPARKGVSRGVQLVQARVRKAPDGLPRLFVVEGALQGRDLVAEAAGTPRGLQKEILGYVWATERGSDGIPKESPMKLNDHSCDAARYAVAYLDWDLPSKAGNPASASSPVPDRDSVWSRRVVG